MLDSALRPIKDALFRPLARPVPSFISPSFITLIGFLCGLASCYHAACLDTPVSLAFWATNRFFDCLDGSVARHRRRSTDLGAFLDLLGDFTVYSLIPISCAFGVAEAPKWGVWLATRNPINHVNTFGFIDTLPPWVRGAMSDSTTTAKAEAARVSPGTSFWLSVAAVEASFHINNFVLFFIAAVLERRRGQRDESGESELMLVAARPALVEGFESGILFTLMLAVPWKIEMICWGMAGLVALGTLQRVVWVVGALRREEKRERERGEKKKGEDR